MPHIGASAQVTLLNPVHKLIFSLEDASNPGVSIEHQEPPPGVPAPYGNPMQVTFLFNCITDHVYKVLVWESTNTTPSGVVRCSYSVTVSVNSVNVRMPLYAQVGVTTGWDADSDTVVDATLEGWDYILRRNPEYLIPDTETANTSLNKYTKNTDGFTLLSGYTLQPDEQWILEFLPQIIVAQPGVPSAPFGSGRIITASENLTNADKNKANIIQSATTAIAIGLPLLSTMADFTDIVYLFSNGGSHINAEVNGQSTDKIVNKLPTNKVWLGQVENAAFYKAFGYYWPMGELRCNTVGELVYNYGQDELNTTSCDGTLRLRSEYPALWAFVQSLADGVVTDLAWTGTFVTHNGNTVYTKRTCFSTGDGVTNFRMPILTNTLLVAIDGSTRLPGSIQLDQVGQYDLTLPRANHTASDPNIGVTDGPPPSPPNQNKTFTINAAKKNIMENSGVYCLMRC